MTEYIPLTNLPRELREITGHKVAGYQTWYRRAVDGDIPAEIRAGNRWFVRREHLPLIMQTMGLVAKEAGNV